MTTPHFPDPVVFWREFGVPAQIAVCHGLLAAPCWKRSGLSFVGWVKPTNSHGDGGFHPPYNCLTGLRELTLTNDQFLWSVGSIAVRTPCDFSDGAAQA
jgi:hypothetical protein